MVEMPVCLSSEEGVKLVQLLFDLLCSQLTSGRHRKAVSFPN